MDTAEKKKERAPKNTMERRTKTSYGSLTEK